MELYFAPMACSLATRMALYEAGVPATFTRVDTKADRTATGVVFSSINPLRQVPVLRTDAGELIIENGAILQYVADNLAPGLAPQDRAGRTQLHHWLSFISTELHKGIFALFFGAGTNDDVKAFARDKVEPRFRYLESHLTGRDYLLDQFSVADAYLATVLNWTRVTGPNLGDWPAVQAYHQRVLARPAIARAAGEEFAIYSEDQRKAAAAK
jgi:glutathione S-transferase